MKRLTPIQMIEQLHADDLATHPKAYLEIATGRRFGCLLWRTDESREQNPDRTILGQDAGSCLRSMLLQLAGHDLSGYDELEDWPSLASVESPSVVEFVEQLEELEERMSYAHMCIMHKGDMDWVIRIDSHHTVGHQQYFPLVRESASTLSGLIEKSVKAFKDSQYASLGILEIPEGTDTGITCGIAEWEATAA